MLTALTMEYSTVIMGDLMENVVVVVKHDGKMYNYRVFDDFSSEDKKNYTECLRSFYNRVLVKESCPDFLDILSPIPLMNALMKNEIVELQYQIYPNSNGNESLYARAIRLYDEKHHFRFMMGFRPMDEVRKKENVLELQREIIEGISKDYFSVLLVDLGNGQIYSYQREKVDIYNLAKDVLSRLQESANKAQVQLNMEGEHAELETVLPILDEIVSNLCDNAIKYNKKGGSVTVTVLNARNQICLSVRDTGIGITAAEKSRVFERFYRVDKSHSKEIGGTGLGLSIVKHGAAYLGAKVELESTIDKGSTFRLIWQK